MAAYSNYDMGTSILHDIKVLLGPDEAYDHFDVDIIFHINLALARARQLGIGPSDGFLVTGEEETWNDFFGDTQKVPMIKGYVYARVKLGFDPPGNSFLVEALKEQIREFECCSNYDVETPVFN